MSEGTLKNSIPRHIEPRRFAQLGVKLAGGVPVDSLTRLAAGGVEAKDVSVDLFFSIDEQKQKIVAGTITALVQLQCQRCLGPLDLNLNCSVSLAAVWNEEGAKALSSGVEPWVVEEDEADLYLMVEDEILLNLPYVAFHEEQCINASLLSTGPDIPSQGADKHNPFQVLKQLKDTTKK